MAYVVNDKLECFIFFLFALSYVLGDRFVDGRRIENLENKGLIKKKGTIKTIEVIMGTKYIFLSFPFIVIPSLFKVLVNLNRARMVIQLIVLIFINNLLLTIHF